MGGGRGRALDPRQLGRSGAKGEGGQGGLGEGRERGEGGTRTRAASAPKLRPPGAWGLGPKTPLCSRGEASSFTVQMRSFQGHVCTGPAGVRVHVCVRVRVGVCGAGVSAAGGDPRRLHPRGSRSTPKLPPPVFRPPRSRPGICARPRPAPTLRRHRRCHRRRPGSHGPRGGREEPGTTCPPPAH